MPDLIPFSFESKSIRVLNLDGAPWFVAKDVAEALEYARFDSNLLRSVPDEWKGTNPIRTPSGVQEMLTLSEPGLYFFVNRSDKPKALPFQKWVAGDVLPSIRQTGSYGVNRIHTPAPETVTLTKDAHLARLEEMLDLYRAKVEFLELQMQHRERRNLDDDEKARIKELRAQWLGPTAIGKMVGRSPDTVETYLRRVRLGAEG